MMMSKSSSVSKPTFYEMSLVFLQLKSNGMCKNIPPFSVSYPHQQHCPEHPQGVFISFFDIFISYILFISSFLMEAKSENARFWRFWHTLKIPWWSQSRCCFGALNAPQSTRQPRLCRRALLAWSSWWHIHRHTPHSVGQYCAHLQQVSRLM